MSQSTGWTPRSAMLPAMSVQLPLAEAILAAVKTIKTRR
jgi:hypothetical protein